MSNQSNDNIEPASKPWQLKRVIPSDPSVGSPLVNELIDAMLAREWSAAEQFRVQLAYEEAIMNAIRHGNRNDAKKMVTVEFECDQQTVTIRIEDEGKGFNPSEVPDPTTEELLEVPGGRGVLLISEIMSEVEYNDKGNAVTMIKKKGDKVPADD